MSWVNILLTGPAGFALTRGVVQLQNNPKWSVSLYLAGDGLQFAFFKSCGVFVSVVLLVTRFWIEDYELELYRKFNRIFFIDDPKDEGEWLSALKQSGTDAEVAVLDSVEAWRLYSTPVDYTQLRAESAELMQQIQYKILPLNFNTQLKECYDCPLLNQLDLSPFERTRAQCGSTEDIGEQFAKYLDSFSRG